MFGYRFFVREEEIKTEAGHMLEEAKLRGIKQQIGGKRVELEGMQVDVDVLKDEIKELKKAKAEQRALIYTEVQQSIQNGLEI